LNLLVPANYIANATDIPFQFSSAAEAKLAEEIGERVQQVAVGITILIILGQLVSKKVIQKAWPLYCTIQILLLTENYSNY